MNNEISKPCLNIYKTNFFLNYIESIKLVSIKRSNFIKRFSGNFENLETFRTLYYSLLYSVLNYDFVIWRPYFKNKYLILKEIIHKLLRFVAYKTGNKMHFADHNYENIAILIRIPIVKSQVDIMKTVYI